MTRIKVCGITRVADAEAAVRAGVDAIGLNFWPGTPRRVDVATARAIVAVLPPMVVAVGLFVDPAAADVRAAMAAVALDVLQFHGDEPPEFCRAFGRRYMKAIAAKEGVDLLRCAQRYDDAAGLIFDAHAPGDLPGGTGRTFDWSRVPRALSRPIVLSGGLDERNVGAAIRAVRPYAVDVSSGVEARDGEGRPRRGVKDPARIDAFIEAVRNADVRS